MIQHVTPKIKEILDMPTNIDGIQQGLFRSNAILMYIMNMVKRGDSKDTIWDMYYLLTNEEKKMTAKEVLGKQPVVTTSNNDSVVWNTLTDIDETDLLEKTIEDQA